MCLQRDWHVCAYACVWERECMDGFFPQINYVGYPFCEKNIYTYMKKNSQYSTNENSYKNNTIRITYIK